MKLFAPLLAALVLGGASAACAQGAPPAPAPAPAPAAPAAEAAAYLAKNAQAPGVKTLPSGLQYKVVTAGPAGASPKPGDVIKVHYEGALVSGQVFDSSFQRGKAALMPLEGLVDAWMEAIPLMHIGDEWTLYVPPEQGYGAEGAGPIPPNSVLVFRIQLLGFLSAD